MDSPYRSKMSLKRKLRFLKDGKIVAYLNMA